MSQVEVCDIRKAFGALEILHGVSIQIQSGKFVVIVGPSGCGKSTLLRIIAGLETVNSGDVIIGEKRVNDAPPKDRDIAMVFQNYALYPHMTVAENMSFSLRLRGLGKEKIESEVGRAADILGLSELLHRRPRELSGGQRQRVAMGRAIVRSPEVFLFDEPLSNLDARLRVQMRTEIKELHQRLGATTIYVTHDQVEAMTMADEIVVMRDGIIEQKGAPLELYDRPKKLFVAEFIGSPSMNFFRGKVVSTGAKSEVVTDDGTRLPLQGQWTAYEGRPVVYGIRPVDLSIGGKGVPITISVLEATGPETQLFGMVGDVKVTALVAARIDARPGEVVNLSFDSSQAHMFDAESGERLEVH